MPSPELGQSPRAIFWREIRRNRLALTGGVILLILYLGTVLAGFLAPYGMDHQHYKAPHDYKYLPPMGLHWIDPETGFSLRPFVYGYRLVDRGRRLYAVDPAQRYPVRFLVRGDAYTLGFGLVTSNLHLFGVDEPGRIFLLGTDQTGRDILSRILYGSQISLSVGLVGIAVSFVIGMILGGVSGYYGGWVDTVIMRSTEVIMSLPGLYLIVALAGILPADLPSHFKYLLIVVILSFIGWAGLARVIRGMVLSLREHEYVQAARALGLPDLTIILRHILPNTLSYVIVAATITVPYYILGEVSLSFLGVGIQEPQASWGLMLASAQNVTVLKYHTWVLIPGAFIFLTVMAFNFLGDGLRDALDPKKLSQAAG